MESQASSSMQEHPHKRTLDAALRTLVENLVLDGVLIHLQSKGLLRDRDKERIAAERTDVDKIKMFVDILGRCPKNVYDEFLNALRENNQPHVAAELMRTPSVPPLASPDTSLDMADGIMDIELSSRSSEWANPVKVNYRHLLDNLQVDNVLIYMKSKGYLCTEEYQEVETGTTPRAKNQSFLNYLVKKPKGIYDDVIAFLCRDNKPHIARLLQTTGVQESSSQQGDIRDAHCMSDFHKSLINKHREALIQNMEIGMVLSTLRSRCIFDANDADIVKSHKPRHVKVEAILELLMKKADSAFNVFVNALEQDNQGHLAALLQETDPPTAQEETASYTEPPHGGARDVIRSTGSDLPAPRVHQPSGPTTGSSDSMEVEYGSAQHVQNPTDEADYVDGSMSESSNRNLSLTGGPMQESEGNTCKICHGDGARGDHVILPCGHSGICQDCVERLKRENKNCPTCRGKIDRSIKHFPM